MAMACQVIDGDGAFQKDVVKSFFAASQLDDVGRAYQVVAIMGPQSSGKSTLLNTVFGTSFTEMNAMTGRQQTTRGVWLAAAPKVDDPRTLVLDLEGNDGRERGEDDTSFERQTALFALAVADVVLINMWAKDIGRETGAGKPLLKTIFQVNLKLFTPALGKRRTVLLFVFRDRTKTPLDKMIEVWEADLARMWDAIAKPTQYADSTFGDFFEVKYAALSNYEEREEDFKAETVMLRRRFTSDGGEKLPGSSLALHMTTIWEVVRANKDLNLPAHRVMVANIRCEQIASDQLAALQAAEGWTSLSDAVNAGVVKGFGGDLGELLQRCLAGYDEEARYFDAGVSGSKRDDLEQQLQGLASPLWDQQVAHLKAQGLEDFQEALKAADGPFAAAAASCKTDAVHEVGTALAESAPGVLSWDVAAATTAFAADIDTAIAAATERHVVDACMEAERSMINALSGPTLALLDSPPDDVWTRLHALFDKGVDRASQRVFEAVEGYNVPSSRLETATAALKATAHAKLEAHVREAANTALSRLRDRFNERFSRDEKGVPRAWGPRVNIPQLASAARAASGRLLAQLAVFRVPGKPYESVDAFAAALVAGPSSVGDDVLALSSWPDVMEEHTLLTPPACRTLWRQFVSDSDLVVQQAVATQEANRAAGNRMPPVWALAAIVLLGWNEFMALVYSPLWLLLVGFIFFFGRTVYQELDVDAEMQRGLLPGILALSAKLLPTVQRVARNTVQSLQRFVQEAQDGYAHKKGEGSADRPSSSTHSNGSIEMTGAPSGLRNRGATSAASSYTT